MNEYSNGAELRAGVSKYIDYYNCVRPHQSLDGLPPDIVYQSDASAIEACSYLPNWDYINREKQLKRKTQDECIELLQEAA